MTDQRRFSQLDVFTALERAGNVFVERVGDAIWIGGDVVACISGSVRLR